MPFNWFGRNKAQPSPPPPSEVPPLPSRRGDLAVRRIASAEAWAAWQASASVARQTERWPLLLGTDYGDAERMEPEETAEDVLAQADAVRVADWLEQRRQELSEELEAEDFAATRLVAEGSAKPSFTVIDGVIPGPEPRVTYLVEVPCREPWMIPSVVPFGGFNECPGDAFHVALFRRWHETHGAVLVGLSNDVAEFYLARPVTDRETARRLAWEMYTYAPDLVHQGTETVEALARGILGAGSWFFWWD